jgi:hypothetical protein
LAPNPRAVCAAIGGLIIWSTGLLRKLPGDEFNDTDHVGPVPLAGKELVCASPTAGDRLVLRLYGATAPVYSG